MQLAKALGAGKVPGTFRSPADREAILEAGADAAIDVSPLRSTLKHAASVWLRPDARLHLAAAVWLRDSTT